MHKEDDLLPISALQHLELLAPGVFVSGGVG